LRFQVRAFLNSHQILGLSFFGGTSRDAVEAITRTGGLLVAPAAPSMVNFCRDPDYRRALLGADLALADSGFMVLLWKILTGERVPRISGLEHMKRLLEHPSVREVGKVLWVVPTENSKARLAEFLEARTKKLGRGPGPEEETSSPIVRDEDVYVAPQYGRPVADEKLLVLVRQKRPQHVVIGVGGGVQDLLGEYLLARLDYRPAVHCIGAALGFLTGDQAWIPDWADRYYLGWLFRSVAQPTVFVPRFWSARRLPGLIWTYRDHLPPLEGRL
jgi:UDP-N-acetyl-D-mannosaminuronic acid transferase (WecB/TagA/CpsF family)